MEKLNRLRELISKLNQYSHEYYNLNQSSISDSEFDSLMDELKKLELETGMVLSNSPTQNVGFTVVSKLKKVKHETPLLSLDKTKEVAVVSKFINNQEYIIMTKNDGLTVAIDYDNGELVLASTRGDGEVGEDITASVKTFKNIPLSIPYKGQLRISGEAVIHYDDFDTINETLSIEDRYKHPRSLASGSVRQLDSSVCSERNVYFYAFNIIKCDEQLSDSKMERFKWLGSMGFTSVFCTTSTDSSEKTLQYYIDTLQNFAHNKKLPIDGMVISFNSVAYSETLGRTSHHPLHSLSFKFEDEVSDSTLKSIEWSVGKTGAITPVAIFEEVEIDGTQVSRASLHNISIMEKLQLGIGDRIGIIKANMIIPQVISNHTRSNNVIIPTHCHCCGTPAVVKQDNDSKVLTCVNEECPAKFLKKLEHFVSRNAMNIEGLSEATLEKLVEMGFIQEFADIYKLEQHKDKIVKMEGFGLKSYTKMIDSINKSRTTEFNRVIYSMSIPLVGRTASKSLAKYFKSDMEDFLDAICFGMDFSIIEDFGAGTNDSINAWCDHSPNLRMFANVLDQIVIPTSEVEQGDISKSTIDLTGQTFVCTGSFNNYSREDMQSLIEKLGGKCSSSVSKKTTYVVAGDKAGSKLDKAKELGVKILTEEEFGILTTPQT